MFLTLLFFGVSLIFGAVAQGTQVCVSNPVDNLTVNGSQLSWGASENCNVSFYIVHIIDEQDIIYHYSTEDLSFDISFLPICEVFRFIITPVTVDNVQGLGSSVSQKILPPSEENFTVDFFNVTETSRNTLFLEWTMPIEVERCIELYRVVIWDDDGNVPHDVYVEENYFNLTNTVPCMNYQFGIRAIYTAIEDEPIYVYNYTVPGVPTNPPILLDITEGVTSVNMTWILQSYTQNRCAISAINIDASPLFNVSHPIDDTPQRPAVAFELLNLQPNTIYLSLVSVVNSVGKSMPLTIALQTRPNNADYDEFD